MRAFGAFAASATAAGGAAYLVMGRQDNAVVKANAAPPPKPIHAQVPTRQQQIDRLKSGEEFDVVVVGGGATGVGIALDAATRGLSVALVERDDFAAGTSSRSTKLIHGGVRYLQKAVLELDYEQYRMVEEALHERATLLRMAPHLTIHLPIMLPIYKWWQVPYYWGGSKMYDMVAGSQSLERSYFLSAARALEQFPMLKKDKLVGAMVYYDGMHNDARMNVGLALTAAAYGACVTNHTEVTRLLKRKAEDGREVCAGVRVRDTITGDEFEVKAKGVINATGPFTDALRKMDDPSVKDIVAPSSGVHVILPDYYSPRTMGLLDPATSDGRVIFFLPWENSTIAGTTDTPTTVTAEPRPREEEIDWILREITHYLSPDVQVRRGDVMASWAGIRPLVYDPNKKNTESLARNHIVHVSPSNLVTVSGGKWTTFRAMAADALDAAIKALDLKPANPCRTDKLTLIGGHDYYPNMYINLIQKFGLDKEVAKHLASNYGDRAPEVARLAGPTNERWPVMGVRLAPGYPFIDGEVLYAVKHEYALTVVDVLARRTRLAFLNATAAWEAAPKVADIMAKELGWSKERKQKELEATKRFLLTMGLEDTDNRSRFNAQEIIEHRRDFGALDTNHDGVITKEDVVEAIKRNGRQGDVSDADLEEFFKSADKNKNGYIEFNEYLDFMVLVKEGKAKKPTHIAMLEQANKFTPTRSGGGV